MKKPRNACHIIYVVRVFAFCRRQPAKIK